MKSSAGLVERPVAADPHRDAARFDDDLDVLDALGDGLGRDRRNEGRECRRSGEAWKTENVRRIGMRRVSAPSSVGAVLDLDGLVEIDRRRLLALADLPAALGRLAIAAPARIAGREAERRHAKHEEVDAAIAMAGGCVDGRQSRRRRRPCPTAAATAPFPASSAAMILSVSS